MAQRNADAGLNCPGGQSFCVGSNTVAFCVDLWTDSSYAHPSCISIFKSLQGFLTRLDLSHLSWGSLELFVRRTHGYQYAEVKAIQIIGGACYTQLVCTTQPNLKACKGMSLLMFCLPAGASLSPSLLPSLCLSIYAHVQQCISNVAY